jgi:hypothetical protein
MAECDSATNPVSAVTVTVVVTVTVLYVLQKVRFCRRGESRFTRRALTPTPIQIRALPAPPKVRQFDASEPTRQELLEVRSRIVLPASEQWKHRMTSLNLPTKGSFIRALGILI